MFGHIIFDIDNTIINYDKSNEYALEHVFKIISKKNNIDNDVLKKEYKIEKNKYQKECVNQASSHNKFIQLKKLYEKLNIDLDDLNNIYQEYLNKFNNTLELYDYVLDFLTYCKKLGIKLYVLSNNLCNEQIERLRVTNVLKYFERIFTSEEYGIEKPDYKIYYSLLQKIGCNNHDVAMIGDNLENDIKPSNNLDIYSFWFNDKNNVGQNYTEFNNYKELLKIFKTYNETSTEFVLLSKYMGERFDLVQAGGGNTSFKIDNIMFIKSSGCMLSDINTNINYVGVNNSAIKNMLINFSCDEDKKTRETLSNTLVNNSIVFLKKYKPSIETTMHSITKKFTVHLHPIQFLSICGLNNCEEIIDSLFDKYCFVDYFTPGIDVALNLHKKYKNEELIFLKNHGIVFTSDTTNELISLVENTMNILEKHNKSDHGEYKFVNKISEEINKITGENNVSLLSSDVFIDSYINSNILNKETLRPYFPDKLIYCGEDAVDVTNNLNENIINYIQKYTTIPKIFIKKYNNKNYLYVSANTLKKCNDIVSVLKSHLMCVKDNYDFLSDDEINYLNNWDAEKFRKKIN